MNCTRCDGTGMLNLEQLDEELAVKLGLVVDSDVEVILVAIASHLDVEHDIAVCSCCGDGDGWYGTPGQHYGPDDQPGLSGPYAYNGGLCECH